MAIKIEKKITGYNVVTEEDKAKAAEAEKQEAQRSAEIVQLGEPLSRPEKLVGNTYKINTPVTEHALYITINDVVMNEGTPQEHRRPFEIFINSKNMDHFQWIVALTRVMSAVFRKGGDVTFLVEELHSVFDPSGG
jgi:formylmethanofuran:tetrahydromethanopterin formyltransferase